MKIEDTNWTKFSQIVTLEDGGFGFGVGVGGILDGSSGGMSLRLILCLEGVWLSIEGVQFLDEAQALSVF